MEKPDLYADIDELLQEFGLEPKLGRAALAAANQSEALQIGHSKDEIMDAKIRGLSAVLFPTILPKTAA